MLSAQSISRVGLVALAIAPLFGYATPAGSESQCLGETQAPRAIVDWATLQRGLKRAFDLKAFLEESMTSRKAGLIPQTARSASPVTQWLKSPADTAS